MKDKDAFVEEMVRLSKDWQEIHHRKMTMDERTAYLLGRSKGFFECYAWLMPMVTKKDTVN